MRRTPHAAVALAALALAASVGAALPGGALQPLPLWAASPSDGVVAGLDANVLGEVFLVGEGLGGARVAKMDARGEVLWVRVLPIALPAVGAFPDSGAVVAGAVRSPTTQGEDLLVQAFDANGDVAWSRLVGYPGDDAARAVAISAEAVFIAGRTHLDGLVMRFDPDGTHRWSSRVATGAEDNLEAAVALPDGGVAVAGWVHDGLRNRALVARLDGFGNVQWQRLLAWDGASLRAHGMALTPRNELLLAGERATPNGVVPWLARLDLQGKVLWERALEGERGAGLTSAASDLAGGLLVAGTHGVGEARDAWLARITPTGGIAWTLRLEAEGADAVRGLAWSPAGLLTVGASNQGALQAVRYVDTPTRPVA
jgi:hypothetical protein